MSDKGVPLYKDSSKPIYERVKDLVSRMTLEEKVSQLLNDSWAIERLDVPEYDWWNECLHGVARAGRATVFPQAIGIAATFDTDLVFRIATAISDEARAKYNAAVRIGNRTRYRGLNFWTPNINIFRDPRWGRGHETYGEDPFLTSQIGVAFVNGLQGDHPKYLKAAACAKHFAVHSGPEADRHHFDAVVTLKDLYETYLPAFKALVDTGVEAVMAAYNRTNGQPCCGSELLLVDILRKKWGFKGHVVSDCWALLDFHKHHKVTSTPEESAALALNKGCDLNCGCVYKHLAKALAKKLITEETIDVSLSRMLTTRFKLGLFDPPSSNPYASISGDVIGCKEHRSLARQAAAKSIVLLKNKDNVLPLKKDIKSVYVLGPNAASTEALMANYYGISDRMVTILSGIGGKVDNGTSVYYKQGCLPDRESPNPIDWSTDEAQDADVIIAVMGLTALIEGEEGDAIASEYKGDRQDIGLPQNQVDYVKKLCQGKTPVIVILAAGSALAIPEIHEIADAILFVWYPGQEGGHAVADVLFGDISPSGRLPVTFPKSTDQLPPYEDYNMTGRTYRYMTEQPLYPFGFGLSYTKFSYDQLTLNATSIKKDQDLTAEVTVTNTGTVGGEEVVQLYLTDTEASVETPLYALKAFQRVNLGPNENKKIKFVITPEMMSLVDNDGQSIIEAGQFKVHIGGTSPGSRGLELGAAELVEAVFSVF